MTKGDKIGLAAVVAFVALAGALVFPEHRADIAPASAEHDCSGRMKEAMASNPDLAKMRTQLCDEGGEAKVDTMIEEAQRERSKAAY